MSPAISHALLSFALVAGLVTIIPGLDTALVLRSALTLGRRQAFATATGVLTGALIWGAAAATGVSVLLTASHLAYTVVRIAGAVYLVWFGISMLRNAHRPRDDQEIEAPRNGTARAYLRGVTTNLLNPKIGAFYVALLPQFIPAHTSHLAMGLALAGIHDVEGFAWFTLIIFGAHNARSCFAKRRVRRALDAVTGSVLVAFGLELAATQ